MPIDDCPHSFETLTRKILPGHMCQMREAIESPMRMRHFGTKGVGSKTILSMMNRRDDFSGCYVLVRGRKPIYVGISRSVVNRLQGHVKGRDHYTATLAYQMAFASCRWDGSRSEAMEDKPFMRLFEAKKAVVSKLGVATVEIDDPVTLCLFEVYCAMKLDTARWNSFRTH